MTRSGCKRKSFWQVGSIDLLGFNFSGLTNTVTLHMAAPITTPPAERDTTKGSKKNTTDTSEEGEPIDVSLSSSGTQEPEQPVTPRPLPVVCLSEGLRRKVTVWELQSWVSLALTLDGRDKITKLLQYTARLLAWWLAGSSHQAERFSALKTSLATSRKALRLGRTLIEYQKLRSSGIIERIGWNLKHNFPENEGLNDEKTPAAAVSRNSRTFMRRVSSNIGWGPVTLEESQPGRKFYRSISSVAFRMYQPMASRLSVSGQTALPPKVDEPMWKIVGATIKMLGLCGFWTADNVSFLTYSGLFDNYQLDKSTRIAERKRLQTTASTAANQFYFVGGIAGLLVSVRSYWAYRETTMRKLQENIDSAEDVDEETHALRAFEKAKEKQFVLFLSLVKSCCDVLVFSNNPGIDLWQKFYGRKMHEGIHCAGGLISASTVLYNNFPNALK